MKNHHEILKFKKTTNSVQIWHILKYILFPISFTIYHMYGPLWKAAMCKVMRNIIDTKLV